MTENEFVSRFVTLHMQRLKKCPYLCILVYVSMNIQVVIVIIILAGALWFIGRRTYRSIAGKHGGSCADCASFEKTDEEKKPG